MMGMEGVVGVPIEKAVGQKRVINLGLNLHGQPSVDENALASGGRAETAVNANVVVSRLIEICGPEFGLPFRTTTDLARGFGADVVAFGDGDESEISVRVIHRKEKTGERMERRLTNGGEVIRAKNRAFLPAGDGWSYIPDIRIDLPETKREQFRYAVLSDPARAPAMFKGFLRQLARFSTLSQEEVERRIKEIEIR